MTTRPRWLTRVVPHTLRARVTALAALAVLGVLTASSVGLVLAQRAALLDTVEETLDQQSEVVVADLRDGGRIRAGGLPSEDIVVEVVAADGTVVASSEDLEGRLLPDEQRPRGTGFTTVTLPDGESARLLTRNVRGTTVLVAGSLEDVGDSTAALTVTLVAVVPLTALVLAGVVWWAVGRALRPVEDMRTRVDSISATRLDQRVPEPATPLETARLARTMNALLGRLQSAAEQQRRFVADASHELRSPLARMRTELEVDAAHPASADPPATAASVLAETIALQRLVDDLLLLARGDAGASPPVPRDAVDLDDVVEATVGALRRTGERRVDAHAVQPVQVTGDRSQLERVVANLLDNAVRHARNRIVVALTQLPEGAAQLTVADDGPGVPQDERERVFERFTRVDAARSAGLGGAGLGLAIARDIAERHGGSLTLDGAGPGARFVLTLPIAREGNPRITRSRPG